MSLFADVKILHIENFKDSTKKLLGIISKFSKAAGYKINTQKSVSFLYTNKIPEKEIKKSIPIQSYSKIAYSPQKS